MSAVVLLLTWEQLAGERHRRTDPACRLHQPPQGRISQWRFDRRRGYRCPTCVPAPAWSPR